MVQLLLGDGAKLAELDDKDILDQLRSYLDSESDSQEDWEDYEAMYAKEYEAHLLEVELSEPKPV